MNDLHKRVTEQCGTTFKVPGNSDKTLRNNNDLIQYLRAFSLNRSGNFALIFSQPEQYGTTIAYS
jgi:hypothetical protein